MGQHIILPEGKWLKNYHFRQGYVEVSPLQKMRSKLGINGTHKTPIMLCNFQGIVHG